MRSWVSTAVGVYCVLGSIWFAVYLIKDLF